MFNFNHFITLMQAPRFSSRFQWAAKRKRLTRLRSVSCRFFCMMKSTNQTIFNYYFTILMSDTLMKSQSNSIQAIDWCQNDTVQTTITNDTQSKGCSWNGTSNEKKKKKQTIKKNILDMNWTSTVADFTVKCDSYSFYNCMTVIAVV